MENNYEQKYKKALDNARLMYDAGNNDVKHIVGQLFHELAESEDEKIRKALIKFFSMGAKNNLHTDGIADKDIIAWLEKQGEKLPAGFYYVNSEGKKFYSEKFKYGNVVLGISANNGKDEQKPTEENKGNIGGISSNWSEEDSPYYDDICEILINLLHSEKAKVNKEAIQKDLDWITSIKKRMEMKQEWSEEDEQHVNSLLKRLEGMCKKGATYTATRFAVSQDIEWLKSLKERKGGKI